MPCGQPRTLRHLGEFFFSTGLLHNAVLTQTIDPLPRQADLKPAAAARFTLNRDGASVLLDDFSGNVQTDAGSAVAFGGVK